MKRLWCGLLLFLLLGATAFSQDIIMGNEDDPYIPEDTSTATASDQIRSGRVLAATSAPVDTVLISQLDCGMFPTICSYVDVLDPSGNPVGGMTVDSFCVNFDGTPVDSFSVQAINLDSCGTSVCLVIDASGSMNDNNKIGAARQAAHNFVDNMDVYDRVAIVKFGACWSIVQNFTSDKATLHGKINTISAQSHTAAFDGIWKGVQITGPELGSKAVIAITDGMENKSHTCDSWASPDGLKDHDFSDDSTLICDLANSTGVPIYTISLGEEFDPQYLMSFAGGTGGSYYHAPTGDDIDTLYSEIKNRLCQRYLICFDSPDTVSNGDWHTTEICRKDDQLYCGPCDTASCQESDVPNITRTPATVGLDNTCQRWDSPVDICAWVTDLDTPQEDLAVSLFYRNADSVSYVSVPMTRTDSLYCATIPASVLTCETSTVQYYITAFDGQVTVSEPPLAPTFRHTFPVCPNSPPVVDAGNDTTVNQCAASQICWSTSASDPDGNLETVELITGPGTFDGSQICFTPTGTLDYEFVLKATDSCGLESFDTVVVYYTVNTPPVADAGSDQSLFMCEAERICWAAGCSDVDGNLNDCSLISGPGSFYGDSICFTPTGAGTYEFVLQATDACGLVDRDTVTIDITLNSAPVCTVPGDTTIVQCSPTQVCLPYSTSDVDGNLAASPCQLVSCPGSLVGGNWCYTPSGNETVVVTIRCEDTCGAYCESQFTVTFDVNEAPVISLGNDTSVFLCDTENLCFSYSTSDADAGQSRSVSLISGFGTLNTVDSTVCFTADAEAVYALILEVEDSCGATTRDTLNVDVTFNSPPVANAGADQTLFQCSPSLISWAASCSDPDGNLASCQLVSPYGTYDGTNINFTPPASGSYDFILRATDACGLTDDDTVTIDVTLNSAPVVTLQADTSLFLCSPQQVCLSYTPSDADGLSGFTEIMVSGYGAIDTLDNEICFTPTISGDYEFIVQVTDNCGATSRDTVTVGITFGQSAAISCPAQDFDEFLCGSDSIIQSLDITPSTATVTLSYGIYADGAVRFLADTAGTYSIQVIAAETCGADTCDLVFNVEFNSPPVADAGSDQSVFQCAPAPICWAASYSDPDGNLTNSELLSGPGTYNGTQICFTPSGSGSYQFVMKATDACGATDYDTVDVDVTVNSAPTVTAQADSALFLCTPQEICVAYTPSDVNGPSGLTEAMLSGYGTIDTAANEICFTPTASGTYLFTVEVKDSCGLTGQDDVQVSVTIGESATISCPTGDFDKFLCGADSIIQSLAISPSTAAVTTSYGTYAGGALRFLADTAGTYVIQVIATESCGADTCDVVFNVEVNSPPLASAGSDQSVFQCIPDIICWAASCSDPDGNLTAGELVSGPGTFNGSQICFIPPGAGSYEFVLRATDACGATDYDTVNVDVAINSAPSVVAQADTSLLLCAPQEVCVSYTPGDIDGLAGLTESMISGFGSIDTANNQLCFTPSAAGTFEFIVGVTDSCGLNDSDTVTVTVSFGNSAVIYCPPDTVFVSLCDTATVCNMVTVLPTGAPVTASFGTYSGGEHCFKADTSGVYVIDLIATSSCGADTCQLVYKVDIGQAAGITCPAPQDIFICEADTVCVPVSVVTPGATVAVTPIGSYNAGNVCFPADTSGHYVLQIVASTSCGSDTCEVVADITINSSPVAVDPVTPVDTFLCTADQICYQLAASDADGGSLEWTRLSGDGTVTAGGLWCFNASSDGAYAVTVSVADSCGAADTTTLTYNVDLNTPPAMTLQNDTSVFVCTGGSYCFGYIDPDDDDNVVLEELIAGSGVLDTAANEVCFSPASSGTYQFVMKATDQCGASSLDTINVTVEIGTGVTVTCPSDTSLFLCTLEEICLPLGVSNASATVDVSPVGYYSAGEVCFTPDTAGHYVIDVSASTDCGTDNCQFAVDVVLNSGPIAVDPPTPVDTFLCNPDQICYLFGATDVDGYTLAWTRLSGSGTVSTGGTWCFNANANGTYSVVVEVADHCGAKDTTTLSYNVEVNSAPVVALGNDTSIFICTGDSYCLDYTVTDDENNITLEQLLSGPGSFDDVSNEICFTPASSGIYEFIVQATDACGAVDRDTINVTVDLGTPVTVSCPADTSLFLCDPLEICRPVTVSDPGASVTVSPVGYYNGSAVCFTPDTSGHYVLTLEAAAACGGQSCDVVVDVVLNSNPVAVDPGAVVDTFVCAAETFCYPFTASDVDGGPLEWRRLSGNGSVAAGGLWCFTASSSGSYAVEVEVEDSCGATDTVSHQYDVTINTSPTLALQSDTSVFLCAQDEICLSYAADDVDGNLTDETLLSGAGVLNSTDNSVCFTPDTNGVYVFVVEIADACGATDTDTVSVTVANNQPPVADAGDDLSLFLCASEEVCFPVSCSDADGNLDTCFVVGALGELENGNVCFTPASSGVRTFVIRAEDECGAFDQDTVSVTITTNSPPTCNPVPNLTFFQCAPEQVSVAVGASDVDDNFDHCILQSGPGSIVNGFWVHTPAGDEVDSVTVRCFDDCGAYCDETFVVSFSINDPPVVDAGPDTTLFYCESGALVSWAAGCTDPNGNLASCSLVTPTGTYSGGQISFTAPASEGTYGFVLVAEDSCGLEDRDTSYITLDYNEPPTLDLPPNFTAFLDSPGQACFGADIYDIDNNMTSVTVSPAGATYDTALGQICFQADTSGTYCFEVTATDNCPDCTVTDTVCVEIEIDECLQVQIEKVHNVLQGQHVDVDIFLYGSGKELGGYDLLIQYEPGALMASGASPGELFEACGWEYFTYRFGGSGNCSGCPDGLMRIVALAETNNGAYHPGCYLAGQMGSLATIDFLVSNDRTLECQYIPVRFYWIECGDNTFSSRRGDTLWLSREVFDFEFNNITDYSFGFPGWVGAPDSCLLPAEVTVKSQPVRCVDFTNGGVDIICADSIDASGDLNLNGVANEIADAVLFTNYFIHGTDAFTISVPGQIAASDVNKDGIPLTVGDLVYLIRVVVGDAPPLAKVHPGGAESVQFRMQNHLVTIAETEANVGAIHMIVAGRAEPVLHRDAVGMELMYHYDGEETRVLIYNLQADSYLTSGPIVRLNGSTAVKEVHAGSYDGRPMRALLSSLPAQFELSQNYPNPFNPTTTIRFGLPKASEWKLDIFNILGQRVDRFEGEGEGWISVEWDASKYASGVYLYRLRAGDFKESKKMLLLK